MKFTKNCIFCGRKFEKPVNESMKAWIYRHRFCSKECANKSKIGKHFSPITEFKNGQKAINPIKRGQRLSPDTEFKNGDIPHNWKGDDVGYNALHQWVKRYKGKPMVCEHCGATSKDRKLAWANKDHRYNRNLDDFISLCYPCHKKYDINRCLL